MSDLDKAIAEIGPNQIRRYIGDDKKDLGSIRAAYVESGYNPTAVDLALAPLRLHEAQTGLESTIERKAAELEANLSSVYGTLITALGDRKGSYRIGVESRPDQGYDSSASFIIKPKKGRFDTPRVKIDFSERGQGWDSPECSMFQVNLAERNWYQKKRKGNGLDIEVSLQGEEPFSLRGIVQNCLDEKRPRIFYQLSQLPDAALRVIEREQERLKNDVQFLERLD